MASDPGGNAAAAWVAGGQVQVARRPVGSSTWTPAVTVSPAGVSATDPDVSVGPTGVAAVVWVAAGDVQVALQPTGQPWGAARNVSDNPTWSDTDPQVEVGPAGVATVVWAGQNAASTIVRSKTASAASISAQDALTPQVTGTFSGLSLARNAAGDAVAAWRWDGAGGSDVQAARRLNGAAWSAPQAQGTVPSVADAPSVTLDGSGNAALGWGSGPTADTNLPYVATWPRGGNLGGPVGLSAAPARRVALAESADGRLAAAWSSPSGLMYADVGRARLRPQHGSRGLPRRRLQRHRGRHGRVDRRRRRGGRGAPPLGRSLDERAGAVGGRLGAGRWLRTGSTRRWSGPTGRAARSGPAPSTTPPRPPCT